MSRSQFIQLIAPIWRRNEEKIVPYRSLSHIEAFLWKNCSLTCYCSLCPRKLFYFPVFHTHLGWYRPMRDQQKLRICHSSIHLPSHLAICVPCNGWQTCPQASCQETCNDTRCHSTNWIEICKNRRLGWFLFATLLLWIFLLLDRSKHEPFYEEKASV